MSICVCFKKLNASAFAYPYRLVNSECVLKFSTERAKYWEEKDLLIVNSAYAL